MKNRYTAAVIAMLFVIPMSVTAQDSATKKMAARTELHSIQSMTLSDEQFLTVRRCTIREEAPGQLINVATRQPFTYKDPCVEREPHAGYDPAATQAARQSVKDLLKTVFKLN